MCRQQADPILVVGGMDIEMAGQNVRADVDDSLRRELEPAFGHPLRLIRLEELFAINPPEIVEAPRNRPQVIEALRQNLRPQDHRRVASTSISCRRRRRYSVSRYVMIARCSNASTASGSRAKRRRPRVTTS